MRRRLLIALSLVLVLGAGAVAALIVRPPAGEAPARADAIAVLSGGSGDRLPRALGLMRRDVTPVLVIPNGTDPKWDDANRLCGQQEPFEVLCPTPEPDTTRGEAAAIDGLAERRSWDRVVVVTSRYHVTRARIIVPRCVAAPVTVVASNPESGILDWGRHVLHEVLGLVEATVLDRGC